MKKFVNVFPNIVVVRAMWQDIVHIRDWCVSNNVDFTLKNHWLDSDGNFLSIEIPNEADRIFFMLRWS